MSRWSLMILMLSIIGFVTGCGNEASNDEIETDRSSAEVGDTTKFSAPDKDFENIRWKINNAKHDPCKGKRECNIIFSSAGTFKIEVFMDVPDYGLLGISFFKTGTKEEHYEIKYEVTVPVTDTTDTTSTTESSTDTTTESETTTDTTPSAPDQKAKGVSLDDTDNSIGKIGGNVTITKASDESTLTHYNLYWGKSALEKGDLIQVVSKSGTSIVYAIAGGTSIPTGIGYLLVFTANSGTEKSDSISTLIVDKHPPQNQAQGVNFFDDECMIDQIGGNLEIIKAPYEDEITHYNLYWGDEFNERIGPIASLEKSGSNIDFFIPMGSGVPFGAKTFLVYTMNDAGEMPDPVFHVLEDNSEPMMDASNLAFTDLDGDNFEIQGNFEITKATDESSLDRYVVYWGTSPSIITIPMIAEYFKNGGDHTHVFLPDTPVGGATDLIVRTAKGPCERPSGISSPLSGM